MNELVFRGYLRPNGQAGVRNIVLVLHTVNCSRHVAAKICAQAREEGIPAELIGNGTCFDEQTVINRMLRLIAHGNVGAVLIVGHGCEFIQAAPLLEFAQSQQKPANVLMDQTLGTETSIALGMEKIRALWDSVRTLARQPLPVSMLTAGLIGASGGAAAQAVCAFGAALLEQGGSVLISGSGGQPEQQTALLAHTEAGPAQARLRRTLDKAAQFYACNRLAPPVMPYTSLCPIRGVLKLTQAPPRRGLWYLDTIAGQRDRDGPCRDLPDGRGDGFHYSRRTDRALPAYIRCGQRCGCGADGQRLHGSGDLCRIPERAGLHGYAGACGYGACGL